MSENPISDFDRRIIHSSEYDLSEKPDSGLNPDIDWRWILTRPHEVALGVALVIGITTWEFYERGVKRFTETLKRYLDPETGS